MKTDKIDVPFVGGMDQRSIAGLGSYFLLQNVMWREDLACFDTAVGWEPLRPWRSGRVYSTVELTSDPYTVYSWSHHQGRIEYVLQERLVNQGILGNLFTLFYEYANGDRVILDSGRTVPSYKDPGTQFIPFGKMLIFLNGADSMKKFWGDGIVTPFGFTSAPPAPQLVAVDPTRLVPNSSSDQASNNNNELNDEGQGIAIFPHLPMEDPEWVKNGSYTLPSGYTLTVNPNQGIPSGKSYFGLGLTTAGDRNTFSYKVSWVSDTGSESPLSESATVSWVVPQKHDGGSGGDNENNDNPYSIKLGVMISDLPTGPDHVVARRLYRTKNKRDGLTGAGDEYYLVAEIRDNVTKQYVDFIPDNELVTPAPGVLEAAVISGTYKYGTVWDGRLWLAGGNGTDQRVIYSQPGKPEQFGGFSFFEVGIREGGPITGLHPFMNHLLIFREHSIDIITNQSGSYQIAQLHPSIGTTATNTIQTVPGLGVLFLSYDGVYVCTGGLEGNLEARVQKLSGPIQKWMDRIAVAALPRATAVYSHKWNEYWVHFPSDGSDVANRGAVFHVSLRQWSVRGPVLSTEAEYWKFHRLAVDREGNILIAPKVHQNAATSPTSYTNVGIQIWSRSNYLGETLPGANSSTVEGGYTYSGTTNPDATSYLISSWLKYQPKGQTVSVLLNAYQSYAEAVTFYSLHDNRHKLDSDYVGLTPLMQHDEHDSSDADPVWATATVENVATYDESVITNHRLTKMRVDLYTAARDTCAWAFRGPERLLLQGWTVASTGTSRETINGNQQ